MVRRELRPATTPKSCAIPHSISNHSPSPVPLANVPQTSGQPASWLSLLGICHWNRVKGLMVSAKQVSRWRPACRPQTCWSRGKLFLQVGQYLIDYRRVFNAGNHLHRATAFTAGLNVDIEHPLETSPPGAYFWCAQLIDARRSAEVCSWPSSETLGLLPLPRLAGVTAARRLLFGANTPWKRVYADLRISASG